MERYVELNKLANGNLEVALTNAGREVIPAMRKCNYSPWAQLYELLEWHTCNGWTLVDADRLGALSEAPVLSESISIESDGYHVNGPIWFYEPYQVLDPVEQLEKHGRVVFQQGGEYHDDAPAQDPHEPGLVPEEQHYDDLNELHGEEQQS